MAPRPCDVSVEDYCRLCAVETKAGVVIYSDKGNTLCLEEKIVQCLRIEVSQDDQLPKKVCEPCHSRLENCHQFAEQANKVQHTLELLVNMKNLSDPNEARNDVACRGNKEQVDDEMAVKSELGDIPLQLPFHSNTYDQEGFSPGCQTGPSISVQSIEKADEISRPDMKRQRKSEDAYLCSSENERLKSNCVAEKNQINYQQEINGQKQNFDDFYAGPDFSDEDVEEEEDEADVYEEDISRNFLERKSNGYSLKGLENEENDDDFLQGMDERIQEDWKTHWGIRCNECGKTFPFKSTFDKHYRTTYNKKPEYTCSYCNKTMLKYSTFRSHCYRHVTEGRYRCEYCQKGFSLRSMLNIHVLAKHTSVKPFICEECGKGFVTKPGLNIHLKKHKNNQKLEFPCDDCGKILHTRGGLTAHKNVHKLGRRFMCDVCGKTFTQKVNMQQHLKHHTGERPHACDKCGKSFAEKSHLNRHYSFHSDNRPFQCKVCMKMYKTERCLKVHAMVHSTARPHVCTYCNKGFLSTTKLKQHYNIHTGERPYACKFCERSFTNYPNWLKHTRRRHKVEPRNLKSLENQEGSDNQLISQEHSEHEKLQHQESLFTVPDLISNEPLIDNPQHQVCLNNSSGMGMQMSSHYLHQSMSQVPLVQTMAGEVLMQQTPVIQLYPEHLMTVQVPPHHMLPLQNVLP